MVAPFKNHLMIQEATISNHFTLRQKTQLFFKLINNFDQTSLHNWTFVDSSFMKTKPYALTLSLFEYSPLLGSFYACGRWPTPRRASQPVPWRLRQFGRRWRGKRWRICRASTGCKRRGSGWQSCCGRTHISAMETDKRRRLVRIFSTFFLHSHSNTFRDDGNILIVLQFRHLAFCNRFL